MFLTMLFMIRLHYTDNHTLMVLGRFMLVSETGRGTERGSKRARTRARTHTHLRLNTHTHTHTHTPTPVSYINPRAHETALKLACRLLLAKKKTLAFVLLLIVLMTTFLNLFIP